MIHFNLLLKIFLPLYYFLLTLLIIHIPKHHPSY